MIKLLGFNFLDGYTNDVVGTLLLQWQDSIYVTKVFYFLPWFLG
jgi:hypothetical protein